MNTLLKKTLRVHRQRRNSFNNNSTSNDFEAIERGIKKRIWLNKRKKLEKLIAKKIKLKRNFKKKMKALRLKVYAKRKSIVNILTAAFTIMLLKYHKSSVRISIMKKTLFLLAILLFPYNVYALEDDLFKNSDMTINFDRLKNIAVFTNDVHVKLNNADIYGDKITVHISGDSKDGNASGDKVKYILITGNVKIKTKDEIITAKKAEYKPNLNQIILTEGVELTQNNNVVTGDKLIYDTLKRTSKLFSSEKKRIKAKFTFDKDE